MSLLNDALRKKRTEQQPPQACETAALFRDGRARCTAKGYWAAGACAVVLLTAAGIWAWRHWHEGPSPAQAFVRAPVQELAVAPAADAEPETQVGTAVPAPPAAPQAPTTTAPVEPQPIPTVAPERPQVSAAAPQANSSKPAAAQRLWRPPGESQPAPRSSLPHRGITSEPLYRKAHLFQRQGRTAEALAMYREVLKLDPNHFDARLNLTSIYLQTEQFTQAYALAADLHREAPDHLQVMLNLAIAQIGCGRTAEGLTLLDKAALRPQAPLYTIFFHKGVALRQLGRIEAAITWYQKAEALNPGDGRLLFNLALAFDQLQSYEPAVAYYLKYLDAAKAEIDAAARGQVQARVRTLRAELAAVKSGVEIP